MARATSGTVVAAASCASADAASIGGVAARRARVRRGACGEAVAARDGLAVVGSSNPTGPRRVRVGVFLFDLRGSGRARFVPAAAPLAVAR